LTKTARELILPQEAQKEKDKWNKNSVNRCQRNNNPATSLRQKDNPAIVMAGLIKL